MWCCFPLCDTNDVAECQGASTSIQAFFGAEEAASVLTRSLTLLESPLQERLFDLEKRNQMSASQTTS